MEPIFEKTILLTNARTEPFESVVFEIARAMADLLIESELNKHYVIYYGIAQQYHNTFRCPFPESNAWDLDDGSDWETRYKKFFMELMEWVRKIVPELLDSFMGACSLEIGTAGAGIKEDDNDNDYLVNEWIPAPTRGRG